MTLLKEAVTASGDNLDNLLRAFFQAEMPHAWPAVEVPSRPVLLAADPPEEQPTRPAAGSLGKSRLALAASIALLISGPLFLGTALRETEPGNPVPQGSGTAQKEKLHPPRYRSSESLLVTPDGVSIRVDISELPESK